jgi:hypothetical protein
MSTNRGIFESLPSYGSNGGVNPFSFAVEAPALTNPFASAPTMSESPFASAADAPPERLVPEPGKPAKIPDRRIKPIESPFQIAPENGSSYGYEAPQVNNIQAAPFATAPTQAPATPAPSPFSVRREPAAATPQQSFGAWPHHQEAASFAKHVVSAIPAAPAPQTYQAPQAPVHQTTPLPSYEYTPAAPIAPLPIEMPQVITQLELRAIFGVDREMSGEEILQRTRALPGIKHVARIGTGDVSALENLKYTLSSLGFDGGNIRLYSGNAPIEFVRDGNTMLAIQTDGGFAPGVKEAIMIVARELEKMA